MPFALIFLKASQFNQMGYFSGLMTFTFLQLMPVDFSGFLVQTAAMLWGLCIFIILVLLFQVRFPKTPGYQTRQKGLLLIGSWLKKQVEGQGDAGGTGAEERKETPEEELHSLEQKLYVEANQKREKKEIITREGKICYMFALMFQRALWETPDSGKKEEEGELYCSLQNLIRPLLIIFRQFEDSEEERQQWAPLESQKLSEKLKYEDSKYRMKTRFIGTAAGCVVISLLLPYFPGASGHFFLAAVMVICMYTATSGTRIVMICRPLERSAALSPSRKPCK